MGCPPFLWAARGVSPRRHYIDKFCLICYNFARRCTNGRRLATSPRGGGRYAYYDHATYLRIYSNDSY